MIPGKTKKIIFSIPEHDKAKFKVQLQYDSLTQAQFLRGMIDGYINRDTDFMSFVSHLKGKLKVQSKAQLKKVNKNLKEMTDITNKFALEDDEVENIFDILEQEHPDL
jgi:Zn-dependent alcohol dehydrogenase